MPSARSPGISNNITLNIRRPTRAACERCRSQKIRCVRYTSSPTCARCSSLGTLCIFEDALPAGRPPANSEPHRKRQETSQPKRPPPSAPSPEMDGDTFNITTTEPMPTHMYNFSTTPTYHNDSIDFGGETMTNLFLDVFNENGLQSSAFTPTQYTNPEQTLDPSLTSLPPALPEFSVDGDGVQGDDQHSSRRPDAQDTPMADPVTSADATEGTPPRYAPQDHQGVCCMRDNGRELADLMVSVQTLLAKARSGQPGERSFYAIGAEFIQGVIQSSSAFFHFLQRLRSGDLSLDAADDTTMIEQQGSSPPVWRSTTNDNSDTLVLTDADRPTMRHGLDTMAAYELLVLYIRLVELQSTLYTRVLHYLRSADRPAENSRGFKELDPLLQGLNVAGVSLIGFGDFQMKLLLQTAAHYLGEIEHVLGLPEAHRVSSVSGDAGVLHGGILEGVVPERSLDLVMCEFRRGKAEPAEDGERPDVISFAKTTLVELQRLLKGSIEI